MDDERDDEQEGTGAEGDDPALDADGLVEEVPEEPGAAGGPASAAKPPPLPPKKPGPSPRRLLLLGAIAVLLAGGLGLLAGELLMGGPPGEGAPAAGDGEGAPANTVAQDGDEAAAAEPDEDAGRETVRLGTLVIGSDGGIDGG